VVLKIWRVGYVVLIMQQLGMCVLEMRWCCRVLGVEVCCGVVQCGAVCCSVVQCGAVCCSVLQCVAVCCSVLQCVAVCCSVLQCVIYLVLGATWLSELLARRCINVNFSKISSVLKVLYTLTIGLRLTFEKFCGGQFGFLRISLGAGPTVKCSYVE